MLWVVGDVASKYGEHFTNFSVARSHVYAFRTSFDQRLDDDTHGLMEQLLLARFALSWGHALAEFGDGKIA